IIFFVLLVNYKSSGFILRTGNHNLSVLDNLMINNEPVSAHFLDTLPVEKVNDEYYHLYLEDGNYIKHLYLNDKKQFFPLDVHDYLPTTVQAKNDWLPLDYPDKRKKIFLPKPHPKVEFIQGKGDISIKKWELGERRFNLTAATFVVLNLKTFYYPGWRMEVTPTPTAENKKPQLLAAMDGRMQLQLSEGVYDIEIVYRGTVAEQWGGLISLGTLFLLILLVGIFRNRITF
ncbi:MAG: hypothetical protein AAGF26_07990, partial [Cyanobacteria bacterium P01_G01_bin.49]